MPQRDDFSEKVKQTISARVGYRCSNPECQAQTSGPHTDPARPINVGVASHITAAAAGGPRYDASQTTADRSSHMNAIWLCQTCSKLIDSDVHRFSVDLLKQWKVNAEALARSILGRTIQYGESPEEIPANSRRLEASLQTGMRALTTSMPPSKKLVANYEAIDFQSDIRSVELGILETFCSISNNHLDVLIITGPAGSGKTRLMLEWTKRLRQNGWMAGFLETRIDFDISEIRANRLIVLDYAETRVDDIIATLNHMYALPCGALTRIVLLSRADGPWLAQIRVEVPWLDDLIAARPIHNLSPLPPNLAGSFYAVCAQAFGLETNLILPINSCEMIAHPLYIQMLTLSQHVTSREPLTKSDLMNQIMDHERRFWWKTARSLGFKPSDKFRRHVETLGWIVAISQSILPLPLSRQVAKHAMPDYDERHFRDAAEVLGEIYSNPNHPGIKPDPLAEHVAVQGVESMRKTGAIKAIAGLLKGVQAPAPTLVLLGRTLSASQKMVEICKQVLGICLPGILGRKGVPNAVADIISALDDNAFVERLDFGNYLDAPVLRVALTGVRFRHSNSRIVLDPRETLSRALEHSEELLHYGERTRLLKALDDSVAVLQREFGVGVQIPVGVEPQAQSSSRSNPSPLWRPSQALLVLPNPVSVFQNGEANEHMAKLLIRQVMALNEAYSDREDEIWDLLDRARGHIDSARLPMAEQNRMMSDWFHAHSLVCMRALRWKSAQESIERVHRLWGKSSEKDGIPYCQNFVNLAICHFHQGQKDRALQLLQQADRALGNRRALRERAKILYNRAVVEHATGTPAARERAASAFLSSARMRRELCDEMPSEGHFFELALALRAVLRGSEDGTGSAAEKADLASEYVSVCERLDALRIDGGYSELLIDALFQLARHSYDQDVAAALCERAARLVRTAMVSLHDLFALYKTVSHAACDPKLRNGLGQSSAIVEILWLAKNLGDQVLLEPGHKFVHAIVHNDLCAELRFNGDRVGAVRVAEDGVRLYDELDRSGVLARFPVLNTERLRMLGNSGAGLLEMGRRDEGVAKLTRLATLAAPLAASPELLQIIARAIDTASAHAVLGALRSNALWNELEARAEFTSKEGPSHGQGEDGAGEADPKPRR